MKQLKSSPVTARSRIYQGKTLDEITALKPFADFDDAWGNGFLSPEAFLTTLHAVMSKD
jgi:hypothetical protein